MSSLKAGLQLKLSQSLTLTPQLQQSIRLLQLSTLELSQEIATLLQQNPFLEASDPEEGSGDEIPEASERQEPEDDNGEGNWWEEAARGNRGEEDDDLEYPQAAAQTLADHLHWQLSLTQLSDRDRTLVNLLIEALNEDGYLGMTVEEVLALLPPEMEVEASELETALKLLQHFDPVGVGARDLSECLDMQLRALPDETEYRDLARDIVRGHLQLLAQREYGKLRRALKCEDEDLRLAQALIVSLNPRPGSSFAATNTQVIVPDVMVRKIKGRWTVSLNPDVMPKIRINRIYADILSRNRGSSSQQLSNQLQEAKWLVKNIHQRFETIQRVSQAIVERQRHFLEHGEVAMRPLVLREIADEVGLHESTISRVTTQKYMATPRGVFELKYFFGSHVSTEDGGACSATAIRALIKQLVAEENPHQPLTDSQITELLSNQGIVVARRTIAKYRESLQIPAVNLRRAL